LARPLLVQLAGTQPSVLVLEDLHWADAGTIDALAYLARRVQQAPCLVIGTYRDDELTPSHPLRTMLGRLAAAPGVGRVHVERLSAAAVDELAARAGRDGTGGTGRDGETVFATTRGNPFFISEMLAAPAGAALHPRIAVAGSRARPRRPGGRGPHPRVVMTAGFNHFRRAAEAPSKPGLRSAPVAGRGDASSRELTGRRRPPEQAAWGRRPASGGAWPRCPSLS
jgi:hypothetical protein